MDPRTEAILIRLYENGPQTERDLRRAGFNYGPTKKALMELEGLEFLTRDQREVWDKPGCPQPYRLTSLGKRIAEETLARNTGKMIVGAWEDLEPMVQVLSGKGPVTIDGFTTHFTAYCNGEIIRDSFKVEKRKDVPELLAWNELVRSSKIWFRENRKDVPELQQEELEREIRANSVRFEAEPDTPVEVIARASVSMLGHDGVLKLGRDGTQVSRAGSLDPDTVQPSEV